MLQRTIPVRQEALAQASECLRQMLFDMERLRPLDRLRIVGRSMRISRILGERQAVGTQAPRSALPNHGAGAEGHPSLHRMAPFR